MMTWASGLLLSSTPSRAPEFPSSSAKVRSVSMSAGLVLWQPPVALMVMSDMTVDAPPRAHARIVYLGPVAPHWEVYADWGDGKLLDEFRARALARLVLITENDPQFRRNRERINRDGERELISLEWDLGHPEDEFGA
jgi:hypothetical protein